MKTAKWTTLVLFMLLVSCGKDEISDCSVSTVTIFDKAFTRFSFSGNSTGSALLDVVKVYDGTDSSYVYDYSYSAGVLTTVVRSEGSDITTYMVTMTGTHVSKFTGRTSTGKNKDETRLLYTNDRIVKSEAWLANDADLLFQISHFVYTYDSNGNLTKSDVYVDLNALLSIFFGIDPSGYSPIFFGSTHYESSSAANPLRGYFFIDNLDTSLMQNIPQKITHVDLYGTIVSSEIYALKVDDSGLLTKATSTSKYIEATYLCQ